MRTLAIRCLIVSFLTLTAASMVGCDEGRPERLRPGGPGPGGGTGTGLPGPDTSVDADLNDADTSSSDAPWARELVAGGVEGHCGEVLRTLAGRGMPRVVAGTSSIFVGYETTSAARDPLLVRFDDGDVQTWCVHHGSNDADARAVGLAWDGGPSLYVVYEVYGRDASLEAAAADGWLASSAPPGTTAAPGTPVTLLARVDAATGALDTATFLVSQTAANVVDVLVPRDAPIVVDGTVEVLASADGEPRDEGGQPMTCGTGPFEVRYRFDADLATLTCADADTCNSVRPCP